MLSKRLPSFFLPTALCITTLLAGCGGGGNSGGGGGNPTPTPTPSTTNEWTWMGGSNTVNTPGVYGTEGVAATTNAPGGRYDAVSWIDGSGNLWLFGGLGANVYGGGGLNDLWEFSPTAGTWTWMSGSSAIGRGPGVYGTQGVPSTGNAPGSRYSAISWTDSSGNLWLFGGNGWDSFGTPGYLNDLWKYSPSAKTWTWVSGGDTTNAVGVYGPQGTASVNNAPGARSSAVSWMDKSGNLWLFGGGGYGSNATWGELNDLWEFNPTTKAWTWMSGSSTVNSSGVYGALGTAATTNTPAGRGNAVSWIDSGGNLWLFGGLGYGSNGTEGCLNDLWEFSPSAKTWTWMNGSNTENSAAVYGTQGVASASNNPGARYSSISWADSSGNLWLFGGTSTGDTTSDLWQYSPTAKTWAWVSGGNTENATPLYGTLGTASASNTPGGRYGAVSWIDSSGNLWLFGGVYISNGSNYENLGDLWRYQP